MRRKLEHYRVEAAWLQRGPVEDRCHYAMMYIDYRNLTEQQRQETPDKTFSTFKDIIVLPKKQRGDEFIIRYTTVHEARF